MARDDYSRDWQQVMGEPRKTQEEIHETIGAMGQLEKTLHRLLIEDFTALLMRHQAWSLGQFEGHAAQVGEVLAGVGELKKDWTSLTEQVTDFGERISQLTITLDEHTDRIAALMELGMAWERRFADLTKRIDAHDTQLADHASRLSALEAYAASVPDAERRRIIGVVEENDRRYRDIQAQLGDVLAQLRTRGDG